MKRSILICIITLILLSGCCNKKIICEKKDNSIKELKITEKIEVNIKNDKVTKIKIDNYIKTFGIYNEYKDELKESIINKYSNIDNNVKIKSNNNGNNINIKIELDTSKIDEDNIKNINFLDVNGSYKYIKKDLENSGYKCK